MVHEIFKQWVATKGGMWWCERWVNVTLAWLLVMGVIFVCDEGLRRLRRQLGLLGVTSTRFLILLGVDGLVFAIEDEFRWVWPVDCMLSTRFLELLGVMGNQLRDITSFFFLLYYLDDNIRFWMTKQHNGLFGTVLKLMY